MVLRGDDGRYYSNGLKWGAIATLVMVGFIIMITLIMIIIILKGEGKKRKKGVNFLER